MKKIIVARLSILVVGLLVLGSQSSVIGYQTQNKDVLLQVEVTGSSSKKEVRLSEDEYQQLRLYLQDFKARLNASTSLDESKSLFKEALGQLKHFGLLPSINVNRLYSRICRVLPKNIKPQPTTFDSQKVTNKRCLVSGDASNVWCSRWSILNIEAICLAISVLINFRIGIGFALFLMLNPYFFTYKPLGFGLLLSLGIEDVYPPGYSSSTGSIYTSGLNGQFSDSGSLWGALSRLNFPIYLYESSTPALFGFTGIKIVHKGSCFFLGSSLIASYVNSTTPP